ncbi:MAG: hypothetical protein KDB27_16025 [Planctomycetales bacterium]|nr:hypothetical protein [Planctomycetales bacterium]
MSLLKMKSLFVISLCLSTSLTASLFAEVPFSIQGPGVDPADFRMTTFASGLNYPVGMAELDDGSIMVAVSNGSSFFGSRSGSIIRLVDEDKDGVADQQSTLFAEVPGGGLSSLRVIDDLVFTTGQGSGKPISILRMGAMPADPLTLVGEIEINYRGSWLHPHSALAVRATPGQANSYDLFFQLGSQVNFATTTNTLSLTSNIGIAGDLAGDAIHMITLTSDGANVSATGLQQIATGLRNPAGFAWHPVTGDLYFEDNGIDGVRDPNEPTSADELNMIPVDQIGGDIEDFGFAENYTEYRTGNIIGGEGIQPLVAFQPIPPADGAEGEGPNDIAFAPAAFPEALQNGVFVGMHGRFSSGGQSNEENPLVFVDLNDNSYFHFITNNEPGVGHLDGLLPTSDSLFIADISPGGGFGGNAGNTAAIYQIKSLVPEPQSNVLCTLGFAALAFGRRSRVLSRRQSRGLTNAPL